MKRTLFELYVGDNGVGLPRDFSIKSANTLGMELIETLTDQLDGTITRMPEEGSYFKILFKGLEQQRADIRNAMKSESDLAA